MDGRELVTGIRGMRSVKVVYVSGRRDSLAAAALAISADTAFLPKPFSRAQLLDVVHELAPAGRA